MSMEIESRGKTPFSSVLMVVYGPLIWFCVSRPRQQIGDGITGSVPNGVSQAAPAYLTIGFIKQSYFLLRITLDFLFFVLTSNLYLAPRYCFLVPFSHKRKHGFLENQLILEIGQKLHKVNSKEVPGQGRMAGVPWGRSAKGQRSP